jgi:hypothetical protein
VPARPRALAAQTTHRLPLVSNPLICEPFCYSFSIVYPFPLTCAATRALNPLPVSKIQRGNPFSPYYHIPDIPPCKPGVLILQSTPAVLATQRLRSECELGSFPFGNSSSPLWRVVCSSDSACTIFPRTSFILSMPPLHHLFCRIPASPKYDYLHHISDSLVSSSPCVTGNRTSFRQYHGAMATFGTSLPTMPSPVPDPCPAFVVTVDWWLYLCGFGNSTDVYHRSVLSDSYC